MRSSTQAPERHATREAGAREAERGTREDMPIDLRWRQPGGMVGLSIVNFLLSVITLGIYSFWGRTEVRRRIWRGIRVNGEPLQYTGTGKELFLGFVIVSALLAITVFGYALAMLMLFGETLGEILMLPLYLVLFWLVGMAIYRARRYRLRRTRWRGIRGTMSGSPARFAWTHFWTSLTVPLTLGWSIPWRQVKLARILHDETRFGNQPFRFNPKASARSLYPPFAMVWFTALLFGMLLAGGIITGTPSYYIAAAAAFVGLIYIWLRYHSFRLNWLAEQIGFGNGVFRLETTPASLFHLGLVHFVVGMLTLGLLMPLVQSWYVGYFVERLSFDGTVDPASILPAGDEMEGAGEGLAQAFDIDMF